MKISKNFSRGLEWKSAPRTVGKLPIVRYIILNEKQTIENDHLTRKINLQNKCSPPLSKWRLCKVRGWKLTYMLLNLLVFILSFGLWLLTDRNNLFNYEHVIMLPSLRGDLDGAGSRKVRRIPICVIHCFEAIWLERGFEGIG